MSKPIPRYSKTYEMEDKELIEFAAIAHGSCKYFNGDWRCPETGFREFNPLNDDGDALRLAVNLGMSIDVLANKTRATIYAYDVRVCEHVRALPNEQDSATATRRAIVRAAAELAFRMDRLKAIGNGQVTDLPLPEVTEIKPVDQWGNA